MRPVWVLLVLLVLPDAVHASPDNECPREPNLLVLVIDALRADHVSAYGYARATTPAIDAFAAGAVRFTRAIAPSNRTGSSMPSIWTGLLPSRHGVLERDQVLADNLTTAAEVLREHGYRTGAWCPNPSLDHSFGHAQGWDLYDDRIIPPMYVQPVWKRFETASTINERFLNWLDRDRNRPFLAWLHYRDVHGPYVPPPPFDRAFLPARARPLTPTEVLARPRYLTLPDDGNDLEYYLAQYDGDILYTDGRIKELLTQLERRHMLERTVVVLTADHGEAFLDHGQWNHDMTLYEEELHVPLVIARPGEGPRVVERAVSTLDLFPTLLELAEAPVPASDGESLLPLLDGRDGAYRRERVYAESRALGGVQRAIRSGTWKLIVTPMRTEPVLFDLGSDPRETRDRAADDPTRSAQLARQLQEMVGHRTATEAVSTPMDRELRRRLEALGYVQ